MKRMKQCLPLVLLLTSCGGGKSYTVDVQNQSAKRFDSVHVFINTNTGDAPAIKSGSLLPGDAIAPLSVGQISSWGKNQPTKVTVIFYAADTVIKSSMPPQAEVGTNARYKAIIDSSLQVNWQ